MSSIEPRSDRRPSRRAREQRAYQLTLVGGGAAAVAVVTGILAVIGILGWSLPILAALVAVLCVVLFRRVVS
jgi:type IV secretory pathway TrbD component